MIKSFRFPLTKNEFFFAVVYFVQAAVGISALAQFIFTHDQLGFNFVQMGLLGALATVSWSIKPIYGFLTDLVPIGGYRRRPYLHIMPLITVLSWLWIWKFADSFVSYAIPLMIANMGLGFTDVICDGLVVQESDEKTVGRFQSICWGSLTVGAIVSTFLSGLLLGREILGVRDMFLLTALIPLITFVFSFFIKEKKITDRAEIKVHKAISPSYIYGAFFAFFLTILVVSPYRIELLAHPLLFLEAYGTTLLMVLASFFVLLTLLYFTASRLKKDSIIFRAATPFTILAPSFVVLLMILSLWSHAIKVEVFTSLKIMLIWFTWFAFYFKHLMDLKVMGTSIFSAAIFIFLWRFTPSFGAPWQDYFLNVVGIDRETYGYFGVVSYMGWLIGSILFAKYFDRFSLKKLLFWTVLTSAILGLTQLSLATVEIANFIGGHSFIKYLGSVIAAPIFLVARGGDFWSYLMEFSGIVHLNFVLDFFLGVLYMISFLALLKFVALSTPKNLEGTNFAVMASIMNLGLVFGSIAGGVIYEEVEKGWWILSGLEITVWLGAITSLFALAVLPWVKLKK